MSKNTESASIQLALHRASHSARSADQAGPNPPHRHEQNQATYKTLCTGNEEAVNKRCKSIGY